MVFLGVTAGFVLQNTKELKQNRGLELKYMEGFKDDVVQNMGSLTEMVENDSAWILTNSYDMFHQKLIDPQQSKSIITKTFLMDITP